MSGPGERRPDRLQSALSGVEIRRRDMVHVASLRSDLVDRMRADHPDLDGDGVVSWQEVSRYRNAQVEEMLHAEKREITVLEREVIDSLAKQQTIVSDNVEQAMEEHRSFGERAADQVAKFGGSWRFLILFGVILIVWMAANVVMASRAFDAYPFILLNLVLSCVAAAQAPIIMMSQRRTEAKDRVRSLNDYQVNLKAELEIRHLHEKVDHLMMRQWERLAELQRLQIEMMQELLDRKRKPSTAMPQAMAPGGEERPDGFGRSSP